MAPRKEDSSTVASSTTDSLSTSPTTIVSSAAPTPTDSSLPTIQTLDSTPTLPIPSPQTSASSSASSDGGGLAGGAKVAIGVLVALAVLGILFTGTIWLLKRRANQSRRRDATRGVYEATLPYEFEEFRPDERSGFISGDRKSMDDEQGHTYGGRARSASQATRSSKRSSTEYLKSRNRRESVGSAYIPGVAMEEAYTMFGGSTATLDRDEEEAEPLHSRRMSSDHSALAALPPRSNRRASVMSEASRYPTMDSARSRRSQSYSGGVDPFSDTTPTGSPAPLHRTFTNPAEGSPKEGGSPPGPSAAGSPPSGLEGRRVSLPSSLRAQEKSSSLGLH